MLAAFLFNPRVLILLVPPVLIIVLLLFIIYKFARPQFDKFVSFFKRKRADPNSALNQAKKQAVQGFHNYQSRRADPNSALNQAKRQAVQGFHNYQSRKAISQKNIELLRQLDQLRQQGILSEQEFEEKKQQILRENSQY